MEMGLSGESGPRVALSGTYQNSSPSAPVDLHPRFLPGHSPTALPWDKEPLLVSPKCCCGALGCSPLCGSQMSSAVVGAVMARVMGLGK